MPGPLRWVGRILRPDVISVALGLIAWQLYGRANPDKLTPLDTVVSTAWRLLIHGGFNVIFSTIGLFAAGVALSLLLATATAALMSGSRAMSNLIRPYLYVFLSVPPLALVPIFMLVWGPTAGARTVAVLFFAYFPMAVVFAEAVEEAPRESIEMARAFGASSLQVFLRVQIPAVAVRLVAGARLGIVRGLKGAVTAEVVMGGVGLGGLLRTYSAGFQLPELYATVLAIVVFSLIVYVALYLIEQQIQRRMG